MHGPEGATAEFRTMLKYIPDVLLSCAVPAVDDDASRHRGAVATVTVRSVDEMARGGSAIGRRAEPGH